MKDILKFLFINQKSSGTKPNKEIEIKLKPKPDPLRQSDFSKTDIPEEIRNQKEDKTYDINKVRKEKEKNDENFNLLTELCDSYLKNKDFDKAFKELNRASQYINQATEQSDYLWKLKIIKEKAAEICFKENNPNYEMYLIYSLSAFALDIIRDFTIFPTIQPFFYRKKNQYSIYDYNEFSINELSLDKDSDIEIALKKLNLFKNREALFKEYNKFIYDDLPRIYGIPPEYDQDSVHKIFEIPNTHPEAWHKLMDFSRELTSKDISYINIKIHDFVAKLIKKYYDIAK